MKSIFNIFSRKPPSFEAEVEQFFKAIKRGNIPVMEKTLDKYSSALTWKNKKGNNCAYIALESGQLKSLEYLLSRGLDVNMHVYRNSDYFKDTALHYACENNKIDFVSLLLDHDADQNVIGKLNIGSKSDVRYADKTPVQMAEYNGYYNIVNLFAAYAHSDCKRTATSSYKTLEL